MMAFEIQLKDEPLVFATNFSYRPVEFQDLRPGAKLIMLDERQWLNSSVDPKIIGTPITLDADHVRKCTSWENLRRYFVVHYVCDHDPDLGCAVRLEDFLDPFTDFGSPVRCVYLIAQ